MITFKRFNIMVLLVIAFVALTFANCGKKKEADSSTKGSETTMEKSGDRGKELFMANCKTCHGETGKGDGPAGLALKPKPRDLGNASSYKQGSTVAKIAKTIEMGIPKTTMAPFKHIPEADRKLIAEFIVTLQK